MASPAADNPQQSWGLLNAPSSCSKVRPRLKGRCTLVRFADDAVLAFEDFLDAKRVLGVLGKRFARYGLSLHLDKTRFVDFRNNRPNGTGHPETNGTSFTFLGFTHIWGKSRAGKNVVRQVTAKNRYARALAAVTAWCRVNRHRPVPDQQAHLIAMMRGHYAYSSVANLPTYSAATTGRRSSAGAEWTTFLPCIRACRRAR
jgi:RNA-directed DNA polymerase